MLIHSPRNLAHYYRDQRKERGVTQVAVSEEIAVRQDTISKFENKPDNVRLDTLFKLLSALDLELHIISKNPSDLADSKKAEWSEQW